MAKLQQILKTSLEEIREDLEINDEVAVEDNNDFPDVTEEENAIRNTEIAIEQLQNAIVSFESFSQHRDNPMYSTALASIDRSLGLESGTTLSMEKGFVKRVASAIWKAIVSFFKWLGGLIKKLFNFVTGPFRKKAEVVNREFDKVERKLGSSVELDMNQVVKRAEDIQKETEEKGKKAKDDDEKDELLEFTNLVLKSGLDTMVIGKSFEETVALTLAKKSKIEDEKLTDLPRTGATKVVLTVPLLRNYAVLLEKKEDALHFLDRNLKNRAKLVNDNLARLPDMLTGFLREMKNEQNPIYAESSLYKWITSAPANDEVKDKFDFFGLKEVHFGLVDKEYLDRPIFKLSFFERPKADILQTVIHGISKSQRNEVMDDLKRITDDLDTLAHLKDKFDRLLKHISPSDKYDREYLMDQFRGYEGIRPLEEKLEINVFLEAMKEVIRCAQYILHFKCRILKDQIYTLNKIVNAMGEALKNKISVNNL